jgi:hypothetical protein
MAIPSYAYHKLKIPGPTRIIIVEARTRQALDYEQSSIELVVAAVTAAELRELGLRLPTEPLNPRMSLTFGIFNVDEVAKAMPIDTENTAKTMQIGDSLDPK